MKDIPPQVVIINPVDGDTWYGGETRDIQWNTIAIPESFKIKIRFVLPGKGEYFIADNLPRSGKFSWQINGLTFQSKQVATGYGGTKTVLSDTAGKLKLIAYDGGKTYEKEVPLSLVIPRLKITSPKNGDTWYVGKTYPVTWQSTGPAPWPMQINIEAGGGFSAMFLSSTNTANTGAANITVPTSPILDSTTNFRLVVLSTLASFPGTYYNDEVSIKVMK
jgi:hypothetical protein